MGKMINEPMIGLTIEQLTDLVRAPEQVAKDLMDARERILKLEYKYKELVDILTDFRANQIMGAKEEDYFKKTKELFPSGLVDHLATKVNVTFRHKDSNDNIF